MATTVKIEGLAELGRALDEMSKATARNTLKRVLKKRAEPIRDKWRAKVAPYRETGHYEDSIIVGTRLTARQAKEARVEGKNFAEIHVGTSDPAALQDEFGNIHQSARAPGRTAWEGEKATVLEGIADDLAAEIEKTRARAARKAAKLAKG